MNSLIEGQELELKREISNFTDVSKVVCAFSNAFGGRFIVGVTDGGVVLGVPLNEIDLIQQKLVSAVQQVSPIPFHKIFIESHGDKKTIVLEVQPVSQTTFCTFNGIVYFRVGSVNTKLEGKTLQDYLINRRLLSFEESVSQASYDDLDVGKIQDFLKKRSPDLVFDKKKLKEYLHNLNLIKQSPDAGIKNACLLFFAKNMPAFFPQNEVNLVRFKGIQPISIIDSRFVNSTLLESLKEAEDFIKKNTLNAFKIQGLVRQEIPEYPENAVREALVNALGHRDYFSKDAVQINIFDNRIEFISPGFLAPGLNISDLGSLSIQRNPLIYRIFREYGLVEGLATGIPRMRELMSARNLPQPAFEEIANFFKVTLFNSPPLSTELNQRQQNTVAFLKKSHSITTKAFAKINTVSLTIAVKELNHLLKLGLIKKIGKTRGAHYELA